MAVKENLAVLVATVKSTVPRKDCRTFGGNGGNGGIGGIFGHNGAGKVAVAVKENLAVLVAAVKVQCLEEIAALSAATAVMENLAVLVATVESTVPRKDCRTFGGNGGNGGNA